MDQICPKPCFPLETEEVNIFIEFCIFELVWAPDFRLNWQIWIFGLNFPKKSVSRWKQKKWISHWIMHIWISVSTKLQVKLINLNICSKFAQKRYFLLETEEVNIPIEFCIFELVRVPNFRLNWQIWIFGLNFPKKSVSPWKQKKWISHWMMHIWISVSTKLQVQLRILIF